ncbi:MAG: hypothetical protein HZC54_24035 [Verrucomicrobia bacterium]|nr:hypothetical protein [Verrucomicrobiota bacterium]
MSRWISRAGEGNIFEEDAAGEHLYLIESGQVRVFKSLPDGGALRLHAAREVNVVRIEVADGGCGIPPESQEKVWQPFVTMGKKHGAGLGLPIARKIVEDHGGTISLQGEVGKGTTFAIRVPIERREAKK